MEVPIIVKTWIDTDGVTVYTVQYKDGSTCDMTVQQYDYLKVSAQAVADLDAQAAAGEGQTQSADHTQDAAAEEPAQDITESPDLRDGYVYEDEELPFEGSLTAYDDNAANTPALFANLPDVDNTFTSIMDWFGDTFFVERTQQTVKTGYTSERYSYNSSTQLIQLPYEETVTETVQVLNPQAVAAAVIVVLTFVTVVTWIKGAIFGRLS